MERKYAERLKKSFKKSLFDTPVPKIKLIGKKTKFLPPPLVPTKYVAPQPVPKPRTQKSRRPVPKPRTQKSRRPVPMLRSYPKKIAKNVKELIDVITPYYRPEASRKFYSELRDQKNLRIIEKNRALKNHL